MTFYKRFHEQTKKKELSLLLPSLSPLYQLKLRDSRLFPFRLHVMTTDWNDGR